MKTFIADIFPKIQRFSQKLDNSALLTNKHWVSIDDITTNKTVYIFRENSELLVSTNGKVEKAKWEYLDNKSLLIDKQNEIYLFNNVFFDQNIFALKPDGSNEYAVFVNQNNYNGDLNSIEKVVDFLKQKYLDPELRSHLEASTGHKFDSHYYVEYIPKLTPQVQKKLDEESEKEEQQLLNWTIGGFILIIIAILIVLTSK